MNRLLILSVLIALFVTPGVSQVTEEWVTTIHEGNQAYDFELSPDGSLYCLTSPNAGFGRLLSKLNSSGDTIWNSLFMITTSTVIHDMDIDANGNIYLTGVVSSFTPNSKKFFLAKMDPNTGDSVWTSTYDGIAPSTNTDEGVAMAFNSTGDIWVTGFSDSGSGNHDVITIRFDSNGDTIWTNRYDKDGFYDQAKDIIVDEANNAYVVGLTRDGGSINKGLVIKYNSLGDTVWTKKTNVGSSNEEAFKVMMFGNSVFVLSNYFEGSNNVSIIKYNSFTGDTIWVARYDGTQNGYDYPFDMTIDEKGNVYMCGTSDIIGGMGMNESMFLAKYDSNGIHKWTADYNGDGNSASDQAGAVLTDKHCNVYISGVVDNVLSEWDLVTIKYDSMGILQWVGTYNGIDNEDDYFNSMALDSNGVVYIFGEDRDMSLNNIPIVIKYCQNVPNVTGLADTAHCAGDTIQLNVSGGNSYLWSFLSGDLSNYFSNDSIHNPFVSANGRTYYIVRATGIDGCWSEDTVEVDKNNNPIPDFTTNETSGIPPLESEFTDQTPGSIVSWEWNLGDGNLSNDEDPIHTYMTIDSFDVTLTVTDDNGCSGTIVKPDFIKTEPAIVAGTIFKETDQDTIKAGIVIAYDKNFPLNKADTVIINTDGSYQFNTLIKGEYYFLAKPDYSTYPNAVPTYFGNKPRWFDGGTSKNLTSSSFNDVIVVDTIESTTGNIDIEGRVSQGNYFGKVQGPGDPLNGLDVSLIDKSSTKTISYQETAETGEGSFNLSSLNSGSYQVYVNIAGIPLDVTMDIDIENNSEEIFLDIIVDSNLIYLSDSSTVGLSSAISFSEAVKVFPNPTSDIINLQYSLNQSENIEIVLYSLEGKRLLALVNGQRKKGTYIEQVALKNLNLAAGQYLVVFEYDNKTFSQEIFITK